MVFSHSRKKSRISCITKKREPHSLENAKLMRFWKLMNVPSINNYARQEIKERHVILKNRTDFLSRLCNVYYEMTDAKNNRKNGFTTNFTSISRLTQNYFFHGSQLLMMKSNLATNKIAILYFTGEKWRYSYPLLPSTMIFQNKN